MSDVTAPLAQPTPAWRWPSIIVLVVAACYLPHLRGDFVWDDFEYIFKEPRIVDADGARRLLTEPFGHYGSVYRPLSTLTFWLQGQLTGLTLLPMRLVNVAGHAAVALLVFVYAQRLGASRRGAGVAAVLFALHTGNVETVMFVNARHDLLGALFGLAALIVARPGLADRGRAGVVRDAVLSALLVGAAMSCKEVFVLIPALAWLAEVLLSPGGWAVRTARATAMQLPAVLVVAALLAWRSSIGIDTGTALSHVTLAERVASVGGVLAWYTPLALSARQGATAAAWVTPASWLSILAVAGLVAAALLSLSATALGRLRTQRLVLIWLGLAWLGLFEAVTAMAVPATGQFANRYLYAPTVGVALLSIPATEWLYGRLEHHARAVSLALALLGASLLSASSSAASNWQTARDLFGADVIDHPDDSRVLYHYGVAVSRTEGCEAALPLFLRAAQLEPTYGRAWHNVSGCLLRLNRPGDAVGPARQALRLAPDDPRKMLNLGVALVLSGSGDEGRALLSRGCASLRNAPECRLLSEAPAPP